MEQTPQNRILSPEEHSRLVDRYTELLETLEYQNKQRDLSGETSHTEELMSGDEINENYIDFGWTTQIEETKREISEIETKIDDHNSSIKPTNQLQSQLDLE